MTSRLQPARIAVAVALALASAGLVHAAPPDAGPPDDDAALQLADRAPVATKAEAKSWQIFGQVAGSSNGARNPDATFGGARAALDLRYDGNWTPELRAVFSDRLDLVHQNETPRNTNVNALREAYVSWRAPGGNIADLGRVNVRHGAALGYNPTDYFKGQSLRFISSPDPASLRTNRLGTVVAQGQTLWTGGSASATISPKLANRPTTAGESLDLGATNGQNRWLLVASHKFTAQFSPEILLHGGQDTPTQVGVNLSGLVNDSTVAFAEYSGGREPSLRSRVLGLQESRSWQQRVAAGVTYTTSFNLSFTAEAEYNSAAPDRQQWNALLLGSPLATRSLLQYAQAYQDIPVRRAGFFYATWHDAFVRQLDISAFLRADVTTHSRSQWIETRYHWGRTDLALQWQLNTGKANSLYGIVPQKQELELSATVFY